MKTRISPNLRVLLTFLSGALAFLLITDNVFAQGPQYAFTPASSFSNNIPFNSSSSNQREGIYMPSFFPAASSGYITTIYFKYTSPVNASFTDFCIMMGSTTLSSFSAGPWVLAGLDTVFFASSFSVTSITNNWIPIQLQTPFYYDNTSNFILLGSQGGYSPGTALTTSSANGNTLYGSSSSTTASAQARLPHLGFDIGAVAMTVNAGSDTMICAGDTAQLSATVLSGTPPYTYNWSPSTGLSDTTIANPFAFPSSNITYMLMVTDQMNDTASDNISVTVNNTVVSLTPFTNVCINWPSQLLTGGLPSGGTYTGNGVNLGSFTPSVAGPGTHPITYTYIDSITGCTGSAQENIFVDECVGMDGFDVGDKLQIFPNPNTGQFTLDMGELRAAEVRILNSLGQEILILQDVNKQYFDLELLPGIYIADIQTAKSKTQIKFVVRQ